jgi:hypothetical protein
MNSCFLTRSPASTLIASLPIAGIMVLSSCKHPTQLERLERGRRAAATADPWGYTTNAGYSARVHSVARQISHNVLRTFSGKSITAFTP